MQLTLCMPIGPNFQQSQLQYLDFVIFADGHGPHVVLLAELLGQGGRHDLPPDV